VGVERQIFCRIKIRQILQYQIRARLIRKLMVENDCERFGVEKERKEEEFV